MSINPEPFDPIRPNAQRDAFLMARMGSAAWLTTPETGAETMEKTESAAMPNAGRKIASNRCIEPGCGKFRVKNKRCSKHSNEFEAAQNPAGAEPPVVKPAKAKEAGAADPSAQAVAGGESRPAMRSLLHLVEEAPAAPARPGFFLDFSGNDELLRWVESLSDDPASDIIALLALVKSGELCRLKK